MLPPSITLREPLSFPVEIIEVDGLHKIMSGNLPVTPMNVTLEWKQQNRGATKASLETYARAARHYVEFAAHRSRSLIDVTNEEFKWFTQALTGGYFLGADGTQRQLRGVRGARTADTMISLLYSLAVDLQEIYSFTFDWYRYRGVPNELVELVRALGGKTRTNTFRRTHQIPYTPKKVLGLPDEEFELLLRAAHKKWGDTVADGDIAFAEDLDKQRGALFYRNLAILLSMRLEGARRSEPPFITLDDIDREKSLIYLVTKGHGGEHGERLPVLLHPLVESAIWVYATRYRPVTDENSVKGYPVFVSHSTRNYGKRISAQTVRKVIDALRDNLTQPWDKLVSPHTLRHSFASDLQKHGGEAATIVNMRHTSCCQNSVLSQKAKNRMNKITAENLENSAKTFFQRAQSIKDMQRKKFVAEYQLTARQATHIFPKNRWKELQNEWALARAKKALDEAYNSAIVRERFTIERIIKLLEGTGILHLRFMGLAGNEWRKRRMQLPTVKEKVLMTIKDLVAKRIPAGDLTNKLIHKTSGLGCFNQGTWFRDAVLAARRELLEHRTCNDIPQPPEGIRTLAIPGGWIDLDADVWDLRSGSGSYLNRSLLRTDIADIAWQQMRDALVEQHLTCGTVSEHYAEYRIVGELLGDEVPDVRKATLERVQRAWLTFKGNPYKVKRVLAALRRLFTCLCNHTTEVSGIDRNEMLLISCWLYTSVSVGRISPKDDFLSEKEMNETITGCLIDIKAGLDFTEMEVDLLSLSAQPGAKENAAVVVEWGWSLMLLLMLFTGLRRESVANLKIGDWSEIRPGLFALIWSHGKKREEKVSILATSVALLLNQYVQRTAKLRDALGTKNVFLTRDGHGYWSAHQKFDYLVRCLRLFTKRHGIERNRKPLKLNCLIVRRTYVTRELYMGRNIWALRLQLGHSSIRTTKSYAKFDLYEHPEEVGDALDEHARSSLTLWNHPLLLTDLDKSERTRLLDLKEERHQDVGLCRYDCCVKMSSGSPPPCSLCENLVTGPDFLKEWDMEQKGRELEMERLRITSEADHLLAQKKSEYELFKINLAFVRKKDHQ